MMDRFETMTCDSEQVVNQAVDREKSLPLCCRFEATHFSFPFPGVLVRDFSSIVFVLRGSMCDGWKDLSVRSRIGTELVGDQLQRWPALVFQGPAKEAFGGSLVSMARDQDVEDVAILIDRSPKIMALAADRDEQLVHMPDVAEPTLLPPQGTSICWSKLPAPGPNRFVRHRDATFGKEIFNIAKAEREAMIQPNGVADDLRRKPVAAIQGFHRSIVAHSR
jgi:hypothetical protein